VVDIQELIVISTYLLVWADKTKHHTVNDLNNKHLFLTDLEAAKLKIGALSVLVPDEASLSIL
jgi:hypothetical protein